MSNRASSTAHRFVTALQQLTLGGNQIIAAEECARLVDELITEAIIEHELDQHQSEDED